MVRSSRAIIGMLCALTTTRALSGQTAAQNDSAARAANRANSLPLITTRTLKFTTDEGSWISLDLSPNGQTIVFDLLGDLYTMPVTGGTAKRIIGGPGWEEQPRFSPVRPPHGQSIVAPRPGQLGLYHKGGGSGLQMGGLRPDGAPAGGPPAPQ